MADQDVLFAKLNMGEVSLLALARTDLEQLRMAAQSMVNWLPRTLGPMMFRPGLQFIGEIFNDQPGKFLPFVAAFADTALLELTNNLMRVWVNDALVTRKSVATVIPAFASWTLAVTGTAVATQGGGFFSFSEINNGASATASVSTTVAPADQNTEHAVRVFIANGPVTFQIGSSAGADDLFQIETLDTGTYSLAFTPGTGVGTIYLQFSSTISPENFNTLSKSIPQGIQLTRINGCQIEGPGVMTLPTPWPLSVLAGVTGNVVTGPSLLRATESADVIFLAAPGLPQYQINRYSPTSWSIVNYRPVKGPMNVTVGNPAVLLSTIGFNGNFTMSSNVPYFRPSDVGTLFRLFHNGQFLEQTVSFEDTFTDCIRVAGVSYVSNIDGSGNVVNTEVDDRKWNMNITGTYAGSVCLERSFEGPDSGFTLYQRFNSPGNFAFDDGLNNEIIWYRAGFAVGFYTSGEATIALSYNGGGGYGVGHVTGYDNPQAVEIEVLVPFYASGNALDWHQSEWSSVQGYPTATTLHEGRLWWSGSDRWWGSTSDDYANFDFDATGDAAYIDISIGQGPIANINWMLSLDHLLAGADTSIIMARSDAIDNPLTPSTINLRQSVTNGSFPIQAVRVDQRAIYVDQSGRRLYELIYDISIYNYKPSDLTRLNPDIGIPGFLGMSVQRQPDTRINLVRTDGVMVSLIYDVADNVLAFWKAQTAGVIEDIVTLPGKLEDQVFVVVKRTIGGVTKRYLERFARIDECQGAQINKNVDAHLVYQGGATNVLTGFNHLIGETVCIWGNGIDLGTAVVDGGGNVTIPDGVQVTAACVGLSYSAEFISAKLAYAAKMGSAINQKKRYDHLGLVMVNTHCQGVRYGQFTPNDPANVKNGVFTIPPVLDSMPQIEYGAVVPPDTVWEQYDAPMFEIPSDSNTDVRLYLQAASPRPATIAGLTFSIDTAN